MSHDNGRAGSQGVSPGRLFRVLTPLLLLLTCVAAINLLPHRAPIETTTAPAAAPTTPPAAAATAALANAAPLPTVTPPQPAATAPPPTPRPTLPPDAVITLLGPPDDLVLTSAGRLSFYWTWSGPPADDARFRLYLLTPAGDQLVAELPEANVGLGYRADVQIADWVQPNTAFAWQVRLEAAGGALAASAIRGLTLGASEQ